MWCRLEFRDFRGLSQCWLCSLVVWFTVPATLEYILESQQPALSRQQVEASPVPQGQDHWNDLVAVIRGLKMSKHWNRFVKMTDVSWCFMFLTLLLSLVRNHFTFAASTSIWQSFLACLKILSQFGCRFCPNLEPYIHRVHRYYMMIINDNHANTPDVCGKNKSGRFFQPSGVKKSDTKKSRDPDVEARDFQKNTEFSTFGKEWWWFNKSHPRSHDFSMIIWYD